MKIGGNIKLLQVITEPVIHPLFKLTKPYCVDIGGHGNRTQICQLQVHLTHCGPTTFFIQARQPQLIDPNLSIDGPSTACIFRVLQSRKDAFNLSKIRVTHDGKDLAIDGFPINSCWVSCIEVAFVLEFDQLCDVKIQFIFCRPNHLLVGCSEWCCFQRILDLVEVVDVVVTNPYHCIHLTIPEPVVFFQAFQMIEHGDALVLPQIMVERFENSPSITFIEVDDIDAEGLFILEDVDPAIAEGLYTLNARWGAVRDGIPAVVFLNIDS